jgi:acyl-coenzyme A synthetase/AMP-(fatty) acid ligase
MNIAKMLEARASRFGEKAAFIFKDNPVTFGELAETTFRFANGLFRHQDLKVRNGDKVAVVMPNSMEYVFSYLSAWCLGATVVPLDYGLTEDEIVACIRHADARVLILKPRENLDPGSLLKKCRILQKIIVCQDDAPGCLSFDKVVKSYEPILPSVEVKDNEYAIIFYTSGTTGKMKGVLISYQQLGVPPAAMEHFVDLSERDVTVCALPFSHLGGLIYIQNCLNYAMTVVLMERFVPAEFLRIIESRKITCFWIVPSMFYAFLKVKDLNKYDLSSLRWMVTFGASHSPESLRSFHQAAPQAHLLNGWGLTETNAPTTVLPIGSDRIESVGKPAPFAKIEIVDEGARPVRVGEVGEIICKGRMVTDGYYKDPELTKETIRQGWFFTGDLGRFDTDGFLYIVGRKKEMIKVAGEIVYEPEVESVVHRHDAVAEAAVVGVPDKLRGEVPKAYIVLKQGRHAAEADIRQFCREHLAHYKIPHYFSFVAELPKNRAGKIDKEALRRGIVG